MEAVRVGSDNGRAAGHRQRGVGYGGMSALARDTAVAALLWDWDEGYEMGRDGERGWDAVRPDGVGSHLTGTRPGQLREAIRADYEIRRVPRGQDPGYAA